MDQIAAQLQLQAYYAQVARTAMGIPQAAPYGLQAAPSPFDGPQDVYLPSPFPFGNGCIPAPPCFGACAQGAFPGFPRGAPGLPPRPMQQVDPAITQWETRLDLEQQGEIEGQTPLWDNEAARQRVDRIASALVPNSTRQDIGYQFKILDSDEINAKALPAGTIYLTRGMLERVKDDRQLAFVLGHEMGHVENHDIYRTGSTLGQVVQGVQEKLGRTPEAGQVINNSMNHFRQRCEFDADQVGQQLMARGGYDPMAAAYFMGTAPPVPVPPGTLLSHPTAGDRYEALEKSASEGPSPMPLQSPTAQPTWHRPSLTP